MTNTYRLWKKAERQRQKWQRAHDKRKARGRSVLAAARRRLMPRPEQTLTEWMEDNLRLPKAVSTESGTVRLYSYQRGIADAIGDPTIERVSVIKSARTGLTTLIPCRPQRLQHPFGAADRR
jgi:phage terminase large subunit GpA-like protein